MRSYAYHKIIYLLVGLACGAYYIASLCSALAVMLDKKETCFLWPKRVVEHGKILIMMVNFIMLQYLVMHDE